LKNYRISNLKKPEKCSLFGRIIDPSPPGSKKNEDTKVI
jgi:hypothetical protein